MADNAQKGELNAAEALSILHWRLIHSPKARNQPRQLLLSSTPSPGPAFPARNNFIDSSEKCEFKAMFLPQRAGFAFPAPVM